MEKHTTRQKAIYRKQPKNIREITSDPKTVAIFVRYSGRRIRDLDGCVASILDELVATKKIPGDSVFEVDCLLPFAIPVEKGQEGFDVVII
ncbi:hypothetical protein LCGC14_3119170 [marine sediment metagenome]|uniref:Uncharacterized protein n=1 Tax=marine sediment metagenome TaxID=412755 RepID=A0A0F8W2Q8_9ZZZZ